MNKTIWDKNSKSFLQSYLDNASPTGREESGQKIWLDYRKMTELPPPVQRCASNWVTNEERKIIFYRSVLNLDKDALEQNHIQESFNLDCEELCEMILATRNKLFAWVDQDDAESAVQAHPIEKQHDYNLLLIHTAPDQAHFSAQRWHLRLGRNGIVHCDSKPANWPSLEEQTNATWLQRLRQRLRWH